MAALAVCGYMLWKVYFPEKGRVHIDPLERPYIVYRDLPTEHERVVVKQCVPIEVIERVPVPGETIYVPIPGTDVPNPGTLFPLYLGSLTIDKLPYGGKMEASLVEGSTGAGKLEGRVVPNQRPRFEWLWGLRAGAGAGYGAVGGPAVGASLGSNLFRYKDLTLSARLEGLAQREGSDLRIMLWAETPIGR